MRSPKKWLFDQEAREKIFKGIETSYRAVSATLGPYGQTVAIDKTVVIHNTKDGVTVVNDVVVEDPWEEMGVKFVREASQNCNFLSGDGTTSTIVIAYAICKEWMHYASQKLNIIKVRLGMDKAVKACVEHMKKLSKKISTEEKFKQVALIASQDSSIAEKVSEARAMAGKHGSIEIESQDTPGIVIEHMDGISFDKGFVNSWFANDRKNFRSIQENVPVLVTDKILKYENQILPIMEALMKEGTRKLFVVADAIEGEALGVMSMNTIQGKFHCCAVTAPSSGKYRIGIMEDICTATGASFLSESKGIRVEKAGLQHLGRAKKVTVDHERTVITSNESVEVKKGISDRIDALQKDLEDLPPDHIDRKEWERRLATFTDGVTILKVGSETNLERHEYKARVDDAVRAVKSAAEEGVVPGGGTMLLRCVPILQELMDECKDEHEKIGMKMIYKGIQLPALRLLEVAGIEDKEYIVAQIKEAKGDRGYDFKSGKLIDLMEAGIVDATKVVRCSLEQAASVAGEFVKMGVACSPIQRTDDLLEELSQKFKSK